MGAKVGFPSQIKYIVGNEAAERFSYYGMRAILTIFMVKYLAMSNESSASTFHYFGFAAYFMPLIGAYLSDRYLGKYKTIIYLSLVYCLGHLALAVFEGTVSGLYLGLALVAIGTGGIKPCVTAHVGDQFSEKNRHLLANVYELFYFSINFGAFFSTLLIPKMLTHYGPAVAFGIPGILMGVATIVFWMGRREYVHVPPSGESVFLPVAAYAAVNFRQKKKGESFLDVAKAKFSPQRVEDAKAFVDVMKLFAVCAVFWALFEQQGASWTLQAEKMDLMFMGMKLESSQIQALNPIMVMALIPLFSFGLYPMIGKWMGFEMTPLRKMTTGMMLAAFSFVVVALLQRAIDSGYSVNVAWQIIPYLIITASEVMVSITGLEFAYTQAPRTMKSTVVSFWLLTVAVGHLIAGVFTQINFYPVPSTPYFLFFAGLMFVAAVVFMIGASRFKVRDFFEKSTENLSQAAGTQATSPS